MAAAEQIKSLIKSFSEGDDSRFYATAMQIAAAEARKGHQDLAEELKKLIQDSKKSKINENTLKRLPVNAAQKELNDLLDGYENKNEIFLLLYALCFLFYIIWTGYRIKR